MRWCAPAGGVPARRRERASRAGRRLAGCLVAGLAAATLSGCAAGYVLRLAYEEARILWRRRPIAEILAGDVDEETRRKLELTLAAREFARRRLGLSVDGSYGSLSHVDEDQTVYVVTAAPRDRLEPYTWWFPIAGSVPYRGYFDRARAEELARHMEEDGYDTYVRSAIAFSTLGWFDDPLLSHLLRTEPVRLVEVILHELLHNTMYVRGQTAFNESFAGFVGGRGAIAFFAERGEIEVAARAGNIWADELAFSAVLGRVVAQIEDAYRDGVQPGERERLFAAARAQLAAVQWRTDQYDGVSERRLNNAILVHWRLYNDRLRLFEDCYRRSGSDLRRTIDTVRRLSDAASDPFEALAGALPECGP